MTFISYAQNNEDVMLWRALKHIDKGFYIDVGANDPVVDSVTKAFYEAGWNGINIEPVSEWYEKLQQDRPRDINLQLAVGWKKGEIDFFEVVGTGLSTIDGKKADQHAAKRDFEIKKYKVPTLELTTICEQHLLTDIHFLKIDVEGSELEVLRSLDLEKFRPWIILIESTLPDSQLENYEGWEEILLSAGYSFAYADGLNRFYVSFEHEELLPAFKYPPNIFDEFRTFTEVQIQDRAWHAENIVNELKEEIKSFEDSSNHWQSLADKRSRDLKEAKEKIKELKDLSNHWQSLADRQFQELKETRTRIDELNNLSQNLQFLYDKKSEELEKTKEKIEELEASCHHWESTIGRQASELEDAKQKIDELNRSSHHWWLESERLNKELQSVYQSKSWRITLPLRGLMYFSKWLLSLPLRSVRKFISFSKHGIKSFLLLLINFILSRPRLKLFSKSILGYFPNIRRNIKTIVVNNRRIDKIDPSLGIVQHQISNGKNDSNENIGSFSVDNLDEILSPEAIIRVSNIIDRGSKK